MSSGPMGHGYTWLVGLYWVQSSITAVGFICCFTAVQVCCFNSWTSQCQGKSYMFMLQNIKQLLFI